MEMAYFMRQEEKWGACNVEMAPTWQQVHFSIRVWAGVGWEAEGWIQ